MQYELKALTLIVEDRECKSCGRSHRVASNLMLKLESKAGSLNGKKIMYTKPRVNSLELDLPRELKEVKTEVEACESCFTEAGLRTKGASLDDQLDLFLAQPKKKYELQGMQVGTAGVLRTLTKVKETKNELSGKSKVQKEETGLDKLAKILAA